jgi:hypothetical protein
MLAQQPKHLAEPPSFNPGNEAADPIRQLRTENK